MEFVVRWWKNRFISTKLYLVVGIMAVLIACELLTLSFAMQTLSSARAFVGGEGLYSKGQKNAMLSLNRFTVTHDERDYQTFLEELSIPEGDHQARLALSKDKPDVEAARQGLLAGHVHPDDIPAVIVFFRRFSKVSYFANSVRIWTRGDELMAELRKLGEAYHQIALSKDPNPKLEHDLFSKLKYLNDELSDLEEEFSASLGEGSRWLEYIVLSILFIAVLAVESIGLTLTFVTSRAISRGLNELNNASNRMGRGDFSARVPVRSEDEIGTLAISVNKMGELLAKSYSDLESRVQERTAALSNIVNENARLYEEATTALHTRDEFLSIASHELRTPLTSLYLQLQLLTRTLVGLPENNKTKQIDDLSEASLRQTRRLTSLLDQLLDLTRLRLGKFELVREECDIAALFREVASQFTVEASRTGSEISIYAPLPVIGNFDPTRLNQVMTNLLSNAIKYGQGGPIEITVIGSGGRVIFSVTDHGEGIPKDLQEKIFDRFERGTADPSVAGMGLGLYITKQIIQAHGGSISVQSERGSGSTFAVELGLT